MSTALLAFVAVILCILFRMLNVHSSPQLPSIWCEDQNFLETVMRISPILNEPYCPTRLWGFSGHMQTIIHSIVGRLRCPWPLGDRVYLHLTDGATLTYDAYQPLSDAHEDDVTIAVCPGIGNTSESVYIRTFVHWAQCHGYRCAVLNHVGALRSVPVTSPRIFTYGHTNDYHEMLMHLSQKYPSTKFVCIGFSLGGNLITKYLGETDRQQSQNIIGGISICQGYCALKGTRLLLNWQNFRRFYLYIMTENMKSIILRHRSVLLSDDVRRCHKLQEQDICAAATLPELDDAYTRRVHGFKCLTDLYKWSSSEYYLEANKYPMVFMNARDDPIVHEELLETIRTHARSHSKTMYVEMANGGHLGFFEGGLVYPNPVSWLDRALVALVGSLVLNNNDSVLKKNVLLN